ncbi:M48 family metallopeptidase [Phocoenobacter skyensis]|uniref:Zn-dependent protease with chaperone function n=1 Tax=Phocoenobacter skyensis TaxID=97481 RepID=A0A1H7YT94_9PAST|nr:M48 family metallopeptidase [Pasteurella skyensis]MDP8184799.1 M48 family metallopeptidase [Pasteurella skyensis]QLB22445.1 peptidase M48 [Pasteurella skyensis]SEM49492.1 Zn-dependent protease with chaperone function [Pasteurella skyensis]
MNTPHTTQAPTVKQFRHKAEMPLLILGYVLTALVTVGCLIVIANGGELKDWSTGILMGLLSPVAGIFFVRFMYYKKVSNGIEMSKKQFPKLYEMYRELALQMSFDEDPNSKNAIPPLYLVNGNGVMNAFASKCALYEKYVVLHSDIVDIAYVHGNFGALRFILAHELGHVKCGHINLRRLICAPIMTVLFLNKSLTRAQEYTADRVACYYAPDDVMGMLYLFAGKNLGKHINIDEYFKNIEKYENNLWLKIVNFRSDHAVGYRRMRALKDSQTKSWDVHGKML